MSPWRRHLLLLAGAYGVLFTLFASTVADMVGVWNSSSTFNHCFLIPFIAVYLALDKRTELLGEAPSISRSGLLFLALNSGIWLAGELMSLAFFMHAAVVGMIIALAWVVLGNRVAKILAFPLFYLYFMVPEGEFLVPYLQDWTAMVLVTLLQLTGIPVFIEGRYLTIPSGVFVVAEACSGVNYLIASLSVGAMFMYMQFHALWRRALFVVAAVVVPLLANGVRAYGIVMISHLSNYKYAQGVDHFIYGWVFFGIVIFALFSIGSVFSDIDRKARDAGPVASIALATPLTAGSALVLAIALFAVSLPKGLLYLVDSARPVAPPIVLSPISGWHGPELQESQLHPQFVGADQRFAAVYRGAADEAVSVDIAYFREQGGRGELISQRNSLFDKTRWKQLRYGQHSLAADEMPGSVNEVLLRNDAGETYLYWYWYESQGRRSIERMAIKLADGLARLQGRNDGAAFIAVGTKVDDETRAMERMTRLVASQALTLDRMRKSD